MELVKSMGESSSGLGRFGVFVSLRVQNLQLSHAPARAFSQALRELLSARAAGYGYLLEVVESRVCRAANLLDLVARSGLVKLSWCHIYMQNWLRI